MAAVAAAERQRAVLEIGDRRHRAPGDRDDLGHPAYIRIAHRDRSAAVVAPGIGLNISEVRIPSDVDARQRIAGQGQEGSDLRLVALKQHDPNGEARFLVKVTSHALPDTHHLRIICDGTYPDRPAHASPVTLNILMRSIALAPRCQTAQPSRAQNSGIPKMALPMNSRRTSPVGAITAPACASRNSRSMAKCLENAAPPHARIAAEVTAIATSPADALLSSTRSMVVSRGRSRWSTRSSTRAASPSVSICIVASCARSVGRPSPRVCPKCSKRALL